MHSAPAPIAADPYLTVTDLHADVVKRNVILRAIRNIKPGDEITYDYGSEYFEIFLKPVGCKCVKCVEQRRRQRRKQRLRAKRKTGK